jgi:hypothetical protein
MNAGRKRGEKTPLVRDGNMDGCHGLDVDDTPDHVDVSWRLHEVIPWGETSKYVPKGVIVVVGRFRGVPTWILASAIGRHQPSIV